MFVTEIRPLNKKKSRILFDDGEDLVLYNGEIRASRIKEQEELPVEVYEKPRDVSAARTDADEKRAGR